MIGGVRRNVFPLTVAFVLVLALVVGFAFFGKVESQRFDAARRVLAAPSDIRLGLTIRHDRGPVVEEGWRLRDLNGVSTSSYDIVGRSGERIELKTKPRETTDVSFLFGLAVDDGIWELPSRPPRGDTTTQYAFDVYQLVDGQHGSYRFHLTDPHYWATTGGHQMHITLDPHTDVRSSMLDVTSTTLVEPRYEKLIADFEAFGTPEFRQKIAESRARIERSSARVHA